MREQIYIASPYSAKYEWQVRNNVKKAVEAAVHIMEKGHYAFIPHLYYFVDNYANSLSKRFNYEWYLKQDISFLERWATGILVVSRSPGVDKEIEVAKNIGIKIYSSLDDIAKAED